MNKKNITPNPVQPIERVPTGRLPSALAALYEETLRGSRVLPSPRESEPEDEDRGGDIGYDSDYDWYVEPDYGEWISYGEDPNDYSGWTDQEKAEFEALIELVGSLGGFGGGIQFYQ